ncbi:flagellar biosynthetic protein FliO [Thalassotalea euphylliae]|nr:flagellar biosynthetic protein FliO [Thalassotalea euphylliae]
MRLTTASIIKACTLVLALFCGLQVNAQQSEDKDQTPATEQINSHTAPESELALGSTHTEQTTKPIEPTTEQSLQSVSVANPENAESTASESSMASLQRPTPQRTSQPMPQLAPQQTAPEVGRHVASNNLELSSMLLSLLAVLALILLAASLLKKFKLGGQLHSDLKVITSMHIGTKERLVVVEVAGKQLLLGVTANNISILQELAEPITSQQNLPVDIAASLSKLLKK